MMQFWCSLILKLHQKCIKTPWNYIKSASKWCSFKTASKLHQECIIFFGHFYIFFQKICWKSSKKHDALSMQFWCSLKPHQKCIKTLWNYIKSASKWCSFKIASKLHQKCIIFLDVSTFFFAKMSACPSSEIIFWEQEDWCCSDWSFQKCRRFAQVNCLYKKECKCRYIYLKYAQVRHK